MNKSKIILVRGEPRTIVGSQLRKDLFSKALQLRYQHQTSFLDNPLTLDVSVQGSSVHRSARCSRL